MPKIAQKPEASHPSHEDYEANLTRWERARAVISGGDAVKAAGESYLPKLEGQSIKEYNAYKSRGNFFNATSRTLDGLVGLIFRRKPTVTIPENAAGVGGQVKLFTEDADMRGTNIDKYAHEIVTEVIGVGRAGSLIDWSDEESRAYVCRYEAEDIINWKLSRMGGKFRLSQVVLSEMASPMTPAPEDKPRSRRRTSPEAPVPPPRLPGREGANNAGGASYETENDSDEKVEQLRVLTLRMIPATASAPIAFEVEIELKQKMRDSAEWVTVKSVIPKRRGKSLPQIPFIFHGPKNSKPDCDKLPLDDLIQTNLDHYRLDVDYKHGLHFTALPTAWVSGFPKEHQLRIGSTTAWVTETPGAQAGFLEFTGQGLRSFVEALDRAEKQMAILGARLLEPQKREAETAEAMEIRQSGESSALTNVAESISESMTAILRWVYWWNSTEEVPEVIKVETVNMQLNRDFLSARMAPEEMIALVKTWQAGAISPETLLHNLRQGEIIPHDVDDETEMSRIKAGSLPQLPPPGKETAPPGNPKPPKRGTK